MSKSIEITVRADEDLDDCLRGAAEAYIADHSGLAGYDLSPRWTDSDRETVTLTVPVRVVVDLGDIEPDCESAAVARGRAIVKAMEGEAAVLLDTDDIDDDERTWTEMVAYLGRRGIGVAYDHDAGYPVARAGVV